MRVTYVIGDACDRVSRSLYPGVTTVIPLGARGGLPPVPFQCACLSNYMVSRDSM